MCADRSDLTYEAMLTDPLIRLVMQSDGVTHDQLVAVLREAAAAVQARAELLPMRPQLTLIEGSAKPVAAPPAAREAAPRVVRPTGTG